MRKRNAFTLIELLVVIAIIALLMSIVIPSLFKAKEAARMVVCSNNERTLVMASNLWSEEHDNYAIAGKWWKDVREELEDGTIEDNSGCSIVPYLASSRKKENDSMTCPSAKNVTFLAQNSDYITEGQEHHFTYASNGYMTYNIHNLSPGTISGPDFYSVGSGREYGPDDIYWDVRGSTKITSIKSPYKISYFIDHEYYFIGQWFFDPTQPLNSFPEDLRFQTRWHKKKSGSDENEYGIGMIGWVDGHVSKEPQDFAEIYTFGGQTKKRWTTYYYREP